MVLLNDFNLIIGNDFLFAAKIAVLPHLYRLLIGDEVKPCFVVGHSNSLDAEVRTKGKDGLHYAIGP